MNAETMAHDGVEGIKISSGKNNDNFGWTDVFKYNPIARYLRNDDFLNPLVLFSYANGYIPNYQQFRNLNGEKLISRLQSRFELKDCSTVFSKKFETHSGKTKYLEWIGIIQKNIWAYHTSNNECTEIYYGPNSDKEVVEEVFETAKSSRARSRRKSNVNLIIHDGNNLALREFQIPKVSFDIGAFYNDEFRKVHNEILKRLKKQNDKGIILLHGEPGTGKTSYLRFLAQTLHKQVIYVPADLIENVAAPNFINFLSWYPNSILIVEDAENVISQRNGFGKNVVANLLNLSDGFLGDCLCIQIVCTFNCAVSRIDDALLRKGRLIAEYEFKKLTVNKSQQLIDRLGFKTNTETEMTLAEIFNFGQNNFHEEKRGIGY
ncbi:MAG: AAA family ATPase [Chitinophagales bacterium]|nr:AAA family ATPase [Chitinophagales bacterium]